MFSGHFSLQLVDLPMEHQLNGFMGCDYNIERLINCCKQFRRLARRDEKHAPVGVRTSPDFIRRTAGDVTRLSGGVGGGRP
jgi:hypothetical protein